LIVSRQQDGLFHTTEDLALRVPTLNGAELELLAEIGALNKLPKVAHRRDVLWQVTRAAKREGPLLRQQSEWLHEEDPSSPLYQMDTNERLVADYAGTGLSIDKHPMYHRRGEMQAMGVLSSRDLQNCRSGTFVRTAGCVIARQRPGTAKGFIFLSMQDETGISNVIVSPDLYEQNEKLVRRSKFLWVEGPLQNDGGVVHVKATRLATLLNGKQAQGQLAIQSHDFH
jgi:error-prone DNA polymerase